MKRDLEMEGRAWDPSMAAVYSSMVLRGGEKK